MGGAKPPYVLSSGLLGARVASPPYGALPCPRNRRGTLWPRLSTLSRRNPVNENQLFALRLAAAVVRNVSQRWSVTMPQGPVDAYGSKAKRMRPMLTP